MKKLMTTMLAVAAGVGLHAADMADTGTSFEGLTGDAPYDIYASTGELSAQEAGQTYWVTNGTETLNVVAGTSVQAEYDHPGLPSRPDRYIENASSQANYLSIKTTLGNPVTRNVSVGGAGTSIGNGFYFDSLVKFTAFEGEQTVDLQGGKLAIWLQENLDDGTQEPVSTNLVVTAGFLDGLGGVVTTNYPCSVTGVDFNDGGWHRVTVKAISSIYNGDTVPGFVVYVDGAYAKSTAAKGIDTSALTDNAYAFNSDGALFPSADQSSGAISTISAVAFDGQGDVDDLVFTATAPDFAKDNEFFTIELGANVESLTYSMLGMGLSVTITETTRIQYTAGMGVTVTGVTYANGYMSDGISTSASVTLNEGYYYPGAAEQSITANAKVAGATLNGEPVESLAAAVATINAAGTGDFTIVLAADATGDIVLNDGENADASVVIDLAGNDITSDGQGSAAILVIAGSLQITNSTVAVGHVVADAEVGIALASTGGDVWISGGAYDGAVVLAGVADEITAGQFAIAFNYDYLDSLNAIAATSGNELVAESGESPVYYLVQEKAAATVNVTVTGGANATPAWTVNGTPINGVPATLNEGDTYEVVYTANTGYEYLLGAITTASGTAGTSDIEITISNAVAINYTISYNLNTAVAAAATNAEGAVTSYTIATPTFAILDAGCVGFNFLGWLDANDAPVTQVAQGSTGNIALTAQWEVITNTVTFKLETDAATAYATAQAPYGQPVITVPENPTKEDCVFSGWSTDGTSANIVDLQMQTFTEDTTLYAVWTVLPPAEKYDAGETIECADAATATAKAAEINAAKENYIKVPSGVTASDYVALFEAVADGNSVTIELTATAEAAEQTAANATATAIASNFAAETVQITAQPGLWYSISSGSTLTGMTEGTRVMATDSNLSEGKLTLTLPETTGTGFYKVNVNLADKPAPVPNP